MTTFDIFEAAREAPDRVALITPEETWTFHELSIRVRAAFDELAEAGSAAGERVVLQAYNSATSVVRLLALGHVGATAVLLHPKLTEAETAALVEDAEPHAVWRDRVERVARVSSSASRETPLAMLYTSGTTGRPKGAMLSRAAFEASARASEKNLGWRDDDRWVLCLPVCHVGGLSVITRCVMARRAVVLLPRFDAGAVLDAVVTHRGTILSVVPTMLRALLDADRDGVMPRLRVVLSGGALTPRALLERCARARVRVLTTYGLTEACSQVTTQRTREGEDAFVVHDDAGVALGGTRVEVVDGAGEVVAAGRVGRIRVKGPQLMTGYWKHPPLGDAWLDTGDLGSLDAHGNLRLSARRTDLIVTGGENVYPAEVEQVIDSLAGVRVSLVFGLADETWGQLVAAAIVREEGASRDEDAWLRETHEAISQKLASHKRPRRVCVVDELPLRSNGKVDRAGAVARFTPRVGEWPDVSGDARRRDPDRAG